MEKEKYVERFMKTAGVKKYTVEADHIYRGATSKDEFLLVAPCGCGQCTGWTILAPGQSVHAAKAPSGFSNWPWFTAEVRSAFQYDARMTGPFEVSTA